MCASHTPNQDNKNHQIDNDEEAVKAMKLYIRDAGIILAILLVIIGVVYCFRH